MKKKKTDKIDLDKIAAIDARADDTRKITNEKPCKINMTMEELTRRLLQTKPKNFKI